MAEVLRLSRQPDGAVSLLLQGDALIPGPRFREALGKIPADGEAINRLRCPALVNAIDVRMRTRRPIWLSRCAKKPPGSSDAQPRHLASYRFRITLVSWTICGARGGIGT